MWKDEKSKVYSEEDLFNEVLEECHSEESAYDYIDTLIEKKEFGGDLIMNITEGIKFNKVKEENEKLKKELAKKDKEHKEQFKRMYEQFKYDKELEINQYKFEKDKYIKYFFNFVENSW